MRGRLVLAFDLMIIIANQLQSEAVLSTWPAKQFAIRCSLVFVRIWEGVLYRVQEARRCTVLRSCESWTEVNLIFIQERTRSLIGGKWVTAQAYRHRIFACIGNMPTSLQWRSLVDKRRMTMSSYIQLDVIWCNMVSGLLRCLFVRTSIWLALSHRTVGHPLMLHI